MENRFLALHFELTNKCNLFCKHCYNKAYIESKEEELSTEQVKEVIDKACSIGVEDIGFSGGEPFIRKDIIELIKYSVKYPIHILTNGLLINSQMIEQLNKIDDLMLELRISLDGFTSHEKIRGVSYKSILSNIEQLLKNDYVVTVNTMVTDDNLDELLEMYEYFKKIHVDRWRLDFIFNSGNAKENNLLYSNYQKLFSTLKKLVLLYIDDDPEIILDINKVFRSQFLYNAKPYTYNIESRPCSYQGSLTVRPNGDVSFCPTYEKTFGNIFKDSIEDIVSNPEWKYFESIQVKNLPEKCQDCSYLKYCGGGCRADGYYTTGNILGVSDFTCQIMKFFTEEIYPIIEKIRLQKKNNIENTEK